jgi:tetratricopeptide (TPR) repeat protein
MTHPRPIVARRRTAKLAGLVCLGLVCPLFPTAAQDKKPTSALRITSGTNRPRPTSALRLESTGSTRATSALRLTPIEVGQRRGIQQVGEASAMAERRVIVRKPVPGPEIDVQKADALSEQGKYADAVTLYQKALTTRPKMATALTGWGFALIEQGNFEEAEKKFSEAIALDPEDADARLNLGVALYRAGRIDDALHAYTAAVEKRKQFPKAYFNLGMAFAHKGQFEDAEKNYQIALTQKPNFREAHNNLGLIFEETKSPAAAADEFRAAIGSGQGTYPLAHYNLGRIYEKQAEYDKAVTEFQTAVRQQPDFAEAHLNLGNIRLIRNQRTGTNELDAAIEAFRKAIDLRKGFYPLAHENLAIALTLKGDRAGAIAEYRVAFTQYEGASSDTLENLLATLEAQENFLIGNELAKGDNPGNLRSKMVKSKPSIERIDELLIRYEEDLSDEIRDEPNVRYCAGRAYIAIGNAAAAEAELARAVEKSGGKDAEANELLAAVRKAKAEMPPPVQQPEPAKSGKP